MGAPSYIRLVAPLASVPKTAPTKPLARSEYPAHAYFKDLCTFNVNFNPRYIKSVLEEVLKEGRVYILKPDATVGDVPRSDLTAADAHIEQCRANIDNNANGWSLQGKPGVPDKAMFQSAHNFGINILADREDAGVAWSSVVQMLLLGQAQPDGEANLRNIPGFFSNDILNIWKNTRKGSLITGFASADEAGKAEARKISPGRHVVVVTMLTDRGFFVWVLDKDLAKGSNEIFKAGAQGDATLAPTFQIDLAAKP